MTEEKGSIDPTSTQLLKMSQHILRMAEEFDGRREPDVESLIHSGNLSRCCWFLMMAAAHLTPHVYGYADIAEKCDQSWHLFMAPPGLCDAWLDNAHFACMNLLRATQAMDEWEETFPIEEEPVAPPKWVS